MNFSKNVNQGQTSKHPLLRKPVLELQRMSIIQCAACHVCEINATSAVLTNFNASKFSLQMTQCCNPKQVSVDDANANWAFACSVEFQSKLRFHHHLMVAFSWRAQKLQVILFKREWSSHPCNICCSLWKARCKSNPVIFIGGNFYR